MGRMKLVPDCENEVSKVDNHADPQSNHVTPVILLPPDAAMTIVSMLAGVVRKAHTQETNHPTPPGQIKRAQEFEEGDVYMIEAPFDGFFADRYLMDFYDVRSRDICSRMHFHTGLRFVRMMTGPATSIRVSSLSTFEVTPSVGWSGGDLMTFTDLVEGERDGRTLTRNNLIVPANSWVDMQIPRGVSHQFNADGPNAVIDSVHPEESLETLREGMSRYRMMAQTIFLAEHKSLGTTCLSDG
jgi:hypothetical protein